MGNSWRLIGDQGNYITQNSFKKVGIFREGLAPFVGFNNDYSLSGYINATGEIEIQLEEQLFVNIDGLAGFFHRRALVYKTRPSLFDWRFGGPDSARRRAYGLMNPQGEIVVRPRYDYIDIQSGCLAVIVEGNRYGAIDLDGNVIIPPTFSYIGDFSEGLAIAQKIANEKYGYIDSRGKFVIDPIQEISYPPSNSGNLEFPERRNFYDGRALYKNRDGKYGYINRAGEIVIAPVFDEAFPFEDGVAKFKNSDSWGYLDISGTIIWQSADIQNSDHSLNHVF
ncbi:MAG: WG repeat-containing protein [Cyanobacteria bacterium P01_F01_bin.56]